MVNYIMPCPFCGGFAHFKILRDCNGKPYTAVLCRECGATIPGDYSQDGEKSRELWNKRRFEKVCQPRVVNGGSDSWYVCSNCGRKVYERDHWCRHCGSLIDWNNAEKYSGE